MKQLTTLLLCALFSSTIWAQDYFPKNGELNEEYTGSQALTNVTLHISPEVTIENGTILIRDGKIVAAGKKVALPQHVAAKDGSGLHVYASFIDPYTNFGVEKPKADRSARRSPQYEPTREGYYWNDHIRPEQAAINTFNYDVKQAEELRAQGFGVAHSHLMDGIARGSGLVVTLNDDASDAERILDDAASQCFSFEKSTQSSQSYPGSLMGSMALLRQMYHDLDWFNQQGQTQDRSLTALGAHKSKPAFFEAGNQANALRAHSIGQQFGIPYILVGSQDAYENIDAVVSSKASFIVPMNFPEAYDLSDPYFAKHLSLEDLRSWNQAPHNLKIMDQNQVPFALTTFELKRVNDFSKQLNKAIEAGLDPQSALKALTTTPAKLLGMSHELGTLEAGKWANFIVTTGPLFAKDTRLLENWVQGQAFHLADRTTQDIQGTYTLNYADQTRTLKISGDQSKLSLSYGIGDSLSKGSMSYANNWLQWSVKNKETDGTIRGTARINTIGGFSGKLFMDSGQEVPFEALLNETTLSEDADPADNKPKKETTSSDPVAVTFPNVGYGNLSLPKAASVVFRNATIWTGEEPGILTTTDLWVKSGKIHKIGQGLKAPGARVIDATGKHLTAGIIDEHSHIGALSINEGGQNSSAEVRITDVINPKDINIYRNLAGGVTSVQILHGSANPIGGQSAIIKLKWGEDADGLLYQDMPKFIKFALGENVKQSNWQSFNRFPQTRMGVEQLYVNYFNRAKTYNDVKNSGAPYRIDEELETLAEILNGERFISCHSYVQSEINMLMKVAESFDFNINTFTHILEGYKVADKMKAHGAGASTFSDWWAYKYEVIHAIPYNAAIMAKEGVTTAINSDDDEMARRLNQEAAKTIKYGGMSELEAWKMVTINPAKLLHLDHRTGSIKEGKDADLVLWNDHPLSVYATAEKTMIDGAIYFDRDQDQALRLSMAQEKNDLIQLMLSDKSGDSGSKRAPRKRDRIDFECETIN
ncbi:MAG: amidohydrolase family protein [Flavobacteriaceae bacterium]|tara:strand:+ start:20716 stop:23685 length:2970 start_codon:yes stop_codon:yes gene_type:complete